MPDDIIYWMGRDTRDLSKEDLLILIKELYELYIAEQEQVHEYRRNQFK